MLRVAVPNKGGLADPASKMLGEAGYRQRRDRGDLALVDRENGVEFLFLRPRDIAVYVGSGQLDLGITGRDLLLDSGAPAEEVLELGFAESTFRFAARPGDVASEQDFAGKRVATSYPVLVAKHLSGLGVQSEVIRLDGAVEVSVRLGVADVIADVVETGSTLRQAGLEIVGEPILTSQAVLIHRSGTEISSQVEQMVRRLRGVLVARRYVMIDYDIRTEHLDAAKEITPGFESPTISPLATEGWVAVRALVPSSEAQQRMDELWELGAKAILTTTIHAARM
ncbi:MAG: ATP phosphoribosyltransferase [Acidimicrobiales bacterium]